MILLSHSLWKTLLILWKTLIFKDFLRLKFFLPVENFSKNRVKSFLKIFQILPFAQTDKIRFSKSHTHKVYKRKRKYFFAVFNLPTMGERRSSPPRSGNACCKDDPRSRQFSLSPTPLESCENSQTKSALTIGFDSKSGFFIGLYSCAFVPR